MDEEKNTYSNSALVSKMHGHWSELFSPQMKGLNPGRLKKSKSNSSSQNVEFTVKYTFHSSSPYNDDLTVTNSRKKSGRVQTKDIINGPHSTQRCVLPVFFLVDLLLWQ